MFKRYALIILNANGTIYGVYGPYWSRTKAGRDGAMKEASAPSQNFSSQVREIFKGQDPF